MHFAINHGTKVTQRRKFYVFVAKVFFRILRMWHDLLGVDVSCTSLDNHLSFHAFNSLPSTMLSLGILLATKPLWYIVKNEKSVNIFRKTRWNKRIEYHVLSQRFSQHCFHDQCISKSRKKGVPTEGNGGTDAFFIRMTSSLSNLFFFATISFAQCWMPSIKSCSFVFVNRELDSTSYAVMSKATGE